MLLIINQKLLSLFDHMSSSSFYSHRATVSDVLRGGLNSEMELASFSLAFNNIRASAIRAKIIIALSLRLSV